jgi:phosphoenolpyruvate-protein kinase (PTS system EI component)
MVSVVEEWRAAHDLWRAAVEQLAAEGIQVPALSVGVMIEVPAAALLADALSREADFLSLGTNDLTQYLFAADRDYPAAPGPSRAKQVVSIAFFRDHRVVHAKIAFQLQEFGLRVRCRSQQRSHGSSGRQKSS